MDTIHKLLLFDFCPLGDEENDYVFDDHTAYTEYMNLFLMRSLGSHDKGR